MNISSNLTEVPPESWSMPFPSRIAVLVVFCVILATGIVGNAAVIIVVASVRTMRTTVNLCLAVLSTADLGVLTLLPILSIVVLFDIDASIIGRNFCLFLAVYDRGALVCSILIFLFISVERYFALCHPLQSLQLQRGWKIGAVLLVIWLLASLVSIPYCYIAQFTIVPIAETNSTRAFCYYEFGQNWMKQYETALTSLMFLLPVPLLCYLYGRMVRSLQTQPLSEPHGVGGASLRKSRSQVIQMLIAVVVIFIICNIPFRIYIFIYLHGDNILYEDMQKKNRIALNWSARLLTFVNNSTNPIIYFSVSTNFRQAFRNVLYRMYRCQGTNYSNSSRIYSTSL